MKTRLIDLDIDYPIVSTWWPAHGWPTGVPRAILPKCGVMVLGDNDEPKAAAWIYMDNSVGVAMMEWAVTNPANKPRESVQAIPVLVEAIRQLAKCFNYGVVLTAAKQPMLVRLYEKSGFMKSDEGMTHLIMTTQEATP